MSTTLLLMLLLPIVGAAGMFMFTKNKQVQIWVWPTAVLVGMALVGLMFWLSYGAATHDTEIWSGQVAAKTRVHGTYEESFQCNCHTDSKGNTSCSTCYRTHYTVKWDCQTTIGDIRIDALDSTWSSVYGAADPTRWLTINQGDPVSELHSYTNYIQAVPNSLFATVNSSVKAKFAGKIPPYPDAVYDIYHVDRFVQYGTSLVEDTAQWNQDISLMLRELGPKKQVNAIIVLVKTDDPNYAEALRTAWNGLKKNDVVLVIGSLDGEKIEFTRVLSWTKNELFKIELADAVQDIGVINRVQIIGALKAQISKNFERRHMHEFEYLKGEIDPPNWLLCSTIMLLLAGYTAGYVFIARSIKPRYKYSWK